MNNTTRRSFGILLAAMLFTVANLSAQLRVLDASEPYAEIRSGHLKMGHPGEDGNAILVNSQFLTIGGKPVVPVMGEIHFSRYDRHLWEDAILKMKANGINIIASYVLWILHEETEGQFNWQENFNLREFALLCKKHELYFYPRIGPWCHAEIRNGGTPDWILTKKYIGNRTNEAVYQYYVQRWYRQIANQLEGMMHKDGGPVIGIQLENEYRRGPGGEAHILWLKQTARDAGFDVPLYTVTGWGNSSIPANEVIPLWGGYPDEPWATHVKPLDINQNYFFDSPKNDENIGGEAGKKEWKEGVDFSPYPYFTCELGIGNQVSEHRRPVIGHLDGLAIATVKTGAGSNLPGYYVFAGGLNPTGIYTSMEENRDETSYYNEYPDISYDFQAAIRETGELAPSYFEVKKLHYFLNEFGSVLAPMGPVFAKLSDPKNQLQFAVRAKENEAFVFGINYLRGFSKPVQKEVRFQLKLKDETISFPSQGVDIPDSTIFIWPVNYNLNGVKLKYATAQMLAKYNGEKSTDWYFFRNNGIDPEFCFDMSFIQSIDYKTGKSKEEDGQVFISKIKPGLHDYILIKTKHNVTHRIFILSGDEALHFWRLEHDGKKSLFISDANLYLNNGTLELKSNKNLMNLTILSNDSIDLPTQIGPSGFRTCQIHQTAVQPEVTIQPHHLLAGSQWLQVSVKSVTSKNQLNKVIFMKEFQLGNPSAIKAATLYLATQLEGNLQVNDRWVNQSISTNRLNQIDLTGYLRNGDNQMMFTLPTTTDAAAFAARLKVDYFNTDQANICTNGSWMTTEQYLIPSRFVPAKNLSAPTLTDAPILSYSIPSDEWSVTCNDASLRGNINGCLHIHYTGDKGRLRWGHRLVSDHYYTGLPWSVKISKETFPTSSNPYIIQLIPIQSGGRIHFDKPPLNETIGTIGLHRIQFMPEYNYQLKLK